MFNHALMILMQQTPEPDYTAMADHFRAESATINPFHIAVLVVILIVIPLAIWALLRYKRVETAWHNDNPKKLFLNLCEEHGLSRKQTKALQAVRRELRLAEPAQMFVDPRLLTRAMQKPSLEKIRAEIGELGKQLFGFKLWKEAARDLET